MKAGTIPNPPIEQLAWRSQDGTISVSPDGTVDFMPDARVVQNARDLVSRWAANVADLYRKPADSIDLGVDLAAIVRPIDDPTTPLYVWTLGEFLHVCVAVDGRASLALPTDRAEAIVALVAKHLADLEPGGPR